MTTTRTKENARFAMLLRYSLFFTNVATEYTVAMVESMKFRNMKTNRAFTSPTRCGEMFTSLSRNVTTGTATTTSTTTMMPFAASVDE